MLLKSRRLFTNAYSFNNKLIYYLRALRKANARKFYLTNPSAYA